MMAQTKKVPFTPPNFGIGMSRKLLDAIMETLQSTPKYKKEVHLGIMGKMTLSLK